MIDSQTQKLPFVDETKIGDCAAQQPISGVDCVNGGLTVMHGVTRGGYIRMPEKNRASAA